MEWYGVCEKYTKGAAEVGGRWMGAANLSKWCVQMSRGAWPESGLRPRVGALPGESIAASASACRFGYSRLLQRACTWLSVGSAARQPAVAYI